MEIRLNDRRILGLPVQFVAVVAFSLALTIYFGAYVADARINARTTQPNNLNAQQFDFRSTAPSSGLVGSLPQTAAYSQDHADLNQASNQQTWEYLFLFACPLH